MPRPPRRASKQGRVETLSIPVVEVIPPSPPIPRRTVALIVTFLLLGHYVLAATSLLRENPTVDEVNHLPAGVSYWQTGSFRLYHHNPPLIKMIAALPILPEVASFRQVFAQAPIWQQDTIPQAPFGTAFSRLYARRYFEIFAISRLVMPLFSVLGGMLVFLWSRQLFGERGAILSLALWCLCPNILAHGRLITSDTGAAVLGALATYHFWRYLGSPTWIRAIVAGLLLGIAQLSKFSMLLLYLLWPVIWLAYTAPKFRKADAKQLLTNGFLHGTAIVALSILTINLGYGFEGTGKPIGSFRFASKGFLTKPGQSPGRSPNQLIDMARNYRVNRFKDTWIGMIPAPLPKHYLLGFDEQKLEADGIPLMWSDKRVKDPDIVQGYTVYLDGELRRTGWRSYYVRCWLYKTPEGTIVLLAATVIAFFATSKARASWGDEAVLAIVPLAFFGAMTFLTDINIGLRYVLPVFPYLFIFIGRLGKLADSLIPSRRRIAWSLIGLSGCLTAVSTLSVYPHYLAYFNTVSGGPDREPPRLIDSNLDWGQDLIGLRDWLKAHPGEGPVGLIYFGQIAPQVFDDRGEGFRWFLPPPVPTRFLPMTDQTTDIPKAARLLNLDGPTDRVTPGLYAVSATIREGVSWRVYDPSKRVAGGVGGTWNARDGAYDYFRGVKPFARIGHSILLFRLSPQDAARLEAARLEAARRDDARLRG